MISVSARQQASMGPFTVMVLSGLYTVRSWSLHRCGGKEERVGEVKEKEKRKEGQVRWKRRKIRNRKSG